MKRALSFLLLSLFIACADEQRTVIPSVVDASKPVDGGTLLRRLEADVATLNPVLATSRDDRLVDALLFTPLIHLDATAQPAPGLAKSWEVSKDGLHYTFKLNPAATFSDGTPVRASDVLFTLRKILDPQSEAVQVASAFDHADLAASRAIDDETVVVAFKQPYGGQLVQFNNLLVLSERVYSQGDFKNDFTSRAVGSGPYKLVRREPGKEIVLERREPYWGPRPHIKTVIFKPVASSATAWNAVRHGDVDEAMISSEIWLREKTNPELRDKLEFHSFFARSYNFIAWNGRDPVLSDKRVRKALARCVNLPAMINDLYNGTARAMNGPFTPDEWAYNPSVPVIVFDPQTAKRELASIGWLDTNGDGILDRGGRPLKVDLIIMSGSVAGMPFAQMLQQELKKIGVQLDIVVLDGTIAIQRILAGNYQAAYLAWDLDPDPDPYPIFHSSQLAPNGQNFVFYSNPKADQLIEAGRRELDQARRTQIYHELHALLADDQPYTWTVQVSQKWAINKRVKGVKESPAFGLFTWYPGELDWWLAR